MHVKIGEFECARGAGDPFGLRSGTSTTCCEIGSQAPLTNCTASLNPDSGFACRLLITA